MKRVYSLLTLMICGLWLQAQQITISLDTVTASPGDSVVVPINVSNLINCGSFSLYIQYDSAVIQWGRALNWNNELQGGIHLANAGNNMVALMWADINGASISSGKLMDLKFRYTGGNCTLNFASNCEVTDLWGLQTIPLPTFFNGAVIPKLSLMIVPSKPNLCIGDSSFLTLNISGGVGNPVIQWSSAPPGILSDSTSLWIKPSSTTTYHVSAIDSRDTSYASLCVPVFSVTAPIEVTNMLPVNGALNVSLPLLLSWSASGNTTSYDLYLWETGSPVPLVPFASMITSVNLMITEGLQYGNTYNWKVISRNPCLHTESQVQLFMVRNLPDLTTTNLLVPLAAYSGQNISLSFQVMNSGTGSTMNTPWQDRLYLSTDTTLETDIDYYIGTYQNITSLNPGESYQQNISFNLPQGISGYYYLFVTSDVPDLVLETNSDNNTTRNTGSFLISLSPAPDLQVSQIIISNSNFSGKPMPVSWKITNFGNAPATVSEWYDRIYLSSDSVLNQVTAHNLKTIKHTGILGIDSSYSQTSTVKIPDYILGKFYIYVVTDFYNAVYEHALENNNIRQSDSLQIFLTPPADLEISSVTAPASASKNELITVTYRVDNIGSDTAFQTWRDKIFISNAANFNPNTALLLVNVENESNLEPGLFYTRTVTLKIPDYISGPYYLYIFTDFYNSVFEYTFEENNLARTVNPIQILAPDPVIKNLSQPVSASSGICLQIQYFNKNNGPGKLIGNWTDKVYISKFPVFIEDSSFLVKARPYVNRIVAAYDSILILDTVTITHGISGNYYLYIVTDYYNTIIENTGETNNIRRTDTTFHINLSSWPDLVVDQIYYSTDTVQSGISMEVNYSVRNQGLGNASPSAWIDRLYLSTNYTAPTTLISVQKEIHSGQLLPDSLYWVNVNLKIPKHLSEGFYYFWIITDANDTVFEYTANSNNFHRGDPIYILPYPPVDLVCSEFSAPDSAYSGMNIPLSWTVKNESPVRSNAYCWDDKFYLSPDTIWDASTDIFLYRVNRCEYLEAGHLYSNIQSAGIPNGVEGNYYIIAVADAANVNNDPHFFNNVGLKRDENGQPRQIHITLSPPPDLIVDFFVSPEVILAGQAFKVKWRVKNIGSGATTNYYLDKIQLSSDIFPNSNDVQLFAKTQWNTLQAGELYDDSLQIFIPAGVSGNYYLIFKTDYNNQVYEQFNENNNSIANSIIIQQPPPSDLVVKDIVPPAQFVIGSGVKFPVSYKIRNSGAFPAHGIIQDLIYLSTDTIWDVNDYTACMVPDTISLAPGQAVSRSFSFTIENLTIGNYYTIIRTDIQNNIFESNEFNNISTSDQATYVDVPVLPLNTLVENTMDNYIPLLYRIEIPSSLVGEVLLIVLKGDSVYGNNEMYVRYGNSPTRTIFDFNFPNANSGNQEILIPYLEQGNYYLMVYGNTSSAIAQSITILAKKLDFSILSVDNNTGGNTGRTTVEILGSKFTSGMHIFLEKDGTIIQCDSLYFVDQSKVYVTFNLTDADTGTYNVVANKLCAGMALLENGFHISQGQARHIDINTTQPSVARPNGIVSIVIEYTNNGNIDLIAPQIEFTSLDNAPISLTNTGLNEGLTTLFLPLIETQGPPGILRPGVSGTITVYAKASHSLSFMLNLPSY